MPIHEYLCDAGCKFERFFTTFKAAEKESVETLCDVCKEDVAHRQLSLPGVPILYGEGFYKPAASGKQATKTYDASKFIKDEGLAASDASGGSIGRRHFEREIGRRRKARRK